MSAQNHDSAIPAASKLSVVTEVRREEALLKSGSACRTRFSTAPTSRASPPTRRASFRSSTSAPSACWATRPPK